MVNGKYSPDPRNRFQLPHRNRHRGRPSFLRPLPHFLAVTHVLVLQELGGFRHQPRAVFVKEKCQSLPSRVYANSPNVTLVVTSF